jgi:hypothetical protein
MKTCRGPIRRFGMACERKEELLEAVCGSIANLTIDTQVSGQK